MNSYEAKQEARRERLMDAAARANLQGESLLNRANEELGAIPFGQPILVGHHSERPMRRLIEKNHNRIRKGLDTIEQAKTLEQRAAAVGSGGISSDDPDAISKLEMKLEMEVISHRRWKAIIKAVRKEDAAALRELKLSADELSTLKFSSCGLGYVLTNASANMRRIRQRIDELKKRATLETRPDIETEWYRVTEDVEANRIRIFFHAKPVESLRDILKTYGFRWSPSSGAWQTFLNAHGRSRVDQVIEKIGDCHPVIKL